MPQVTLAIAADDLGSRPIRIGMSLDGTFDFVIEAGPTAIASELRFAFEGSMAVRLFAKVLAAEDFEVLWLLSELVAK